MKDTLRAEPPFPLSVNPSRSPSPSSRFQNTLIFVYDSNLWRRQVAKRYPSARYVGVARLRHWRWQINEHGIANVVESPAPPYSPATARWLGPLSTGGDGSGRDDNERVYGMVYELGPEDEERIDTGVEKQCSKESSWMELWSAKDQHGDSATDQKVNIMKKPRRVRVVFYVDRTNVADGKAIYDAKYAYKLAQGVRDARDAGIPETYLDQCVRPYLPKVEDAELKAAIKNAVLAGVDVKSLLEEAEDELVATKKVTDSPVEDNEDGLRKVLNTNMPEANGPTRSRSYSRPWEAQIAGDNGSRALPSIS